MRRSLSVRSTCLLGLVLTTTLFGIGTIWPMPAADVARGYASGGDATATMDRARSEPLAPSRRPPRGGDEEAGSVRPLVDLSLLAAPTAGGASLMAERLTYAPGATVSVRPHTQVRVVSLEAGTLDVRIDGVAFLDRRWPAGSLLDREPHRVEGIVHLHPGDLLAVPVEAAFMARNPAELPAVSLEVRVQLPQPLTPMTDRLGDASDSGAVHAERLGAAIAMPPGGSAVLTVSRVILPPGGSIVAAQSAGPALVIVERGLLGATRDGPEARRAPGEVELVPRGARATIRSTGEAPLATLLLTITPAESGRAPA